MIRVLAALVAGFLCLPAWSADCHILEFSAIQDVGGQSVQVALTPALAEQHLNDFTTTVASAAFNNLTNFIRIVCDSKTFFEISTDPSAATTNSYLSADTPEYFGVTQGTALKIAVATE
jgi:hypothetical protein